MSADDFQAAVQRLLAQVGHWETGRWSRVAAAAPGTRADLVHTLVQRLADLGADAEHRPHHPVPREHDMILPDQLRVMSDDLLAATPSPESLTEATTAITSVRAAL
ncbi:hypothetical protein [Winogradskya humida]|uniref:Uncharacterized protein n=1 Tax=Winogradskya humida TaxID=113566 RepID=A0ABQ3ZK77_9ACTN|nr:hypothetical protein [Actinoplanes humidus]GIE18986.1 hypothetical protein Ahu01nite_020880 [Actinoplanes humidus]